jgi:hypothetical protein
MTLLGVYCGFSTAIKAISVKIQPRKSKKAACTEAPFYVPNRIFVLYMIETVVGRSVRSPRTIYLAMSDYLNSFTDSMGSALAMMV